MREKLQGSSQPFEPAERHLTETADALRECEWTAFGSPSPNGGTTLTQLFVQINPKDALLRVKYAMTE